MKRTIDLPDDLLTRAKVYAAQHKTTLKDVVVQGLLQIINEPALASDQARRRDAPRIIEALQAGNTKRMEPLTREEIYDRTKPRRK